MYRIAMHCECFVFLFCSHGISLSPASSFTSSLFCCTLFLFPDPVLFYFPSSSFFPPWFLIFSSTPCLLLQEHLATSSSADAAFDSSIVHPFTPPRFPSISTALFLCSLSFSFWSLQPVNFQTTFCSVPLPSSFLISFTNISPTVSYCCVVLLKLDDFLGYEPPPSGQNWPRSRDQQSTSSLLH